MTVEDFHNTPGIYQGPLNTRPSAGNDGRLFVDTTNDRIQRDTGSEWKTLDAELGLDVVENLSGVPGIEAGDQDQMPSAGTEGNLYITKDTQNLYRDNGSNWELIGDKQVFVDFGEVDSSSDFTPTISGSLTGAVQVQTFFVADEVDVIQEVDVDGDGTYEIQETAKSFSSNVSSRGVDQDNEILVDTNQDMRLRFTTTKSSTFKVGLEGVSVATPHPSGTRAGEVVVDHTNGNSAFNPSIDNVDRVEWHNFLGADKVEYQIDLDGDGTYETTITVDENLSGNLSQGNRIVTDSDNSRLKVTTASSNDAIVTGIKKL